MLCSSQQPPPQSTASTSVCTYGSQAVAQSAQYGGPGRRAQVQGTGQAEAVKLTQLGITLQLESGTARTDTCVSPEGSASQSTSSASDAGQGALEDAETRSRGRR
jgi:hypothetical protein